MFRQLDHDPYDVLSYPHLTVGHPVARPGRRTSARVGEDAEAPIFELLRSTVGLPLDDPQWWPGDLPGAGVLAHPSVELLERTLAGLHAWGAGTGQRPGRHVIVPVAELLSRP